MTWLDVNQNIEIIFDANTYFYLNSNITNKPNSFGF